MINKVLIFSLISVLILINACSPEPDPAPTETPVATEAPTETPEATATEERVESGFYTNASGSWAPIYTDEMTGPVFLPEDMTGGDMDMMQLVQSGYYSDYDPDSMVLTIYAAVPPGGTYRLIEVQLTANQIVICLPEKVGDTAIENLSYMPSGGKVNFPPGPGNQSIADIAEEISDQSFTVVILSEPVNDEAINPANQLAMVCP